MLDIVWIIVATALVLLMQAGFTCFETGLIRSKNSINVAIKNLMDLCVSGSIFWLFGYGFMFGSSISGRIGRDGFLFGLQVSSFEQAFFLFQMMFCGTAIILVSGAVAERMSIYGYLIAALIMAALIYPVIGHWAWAGLQHGKLVGWLGASGFIDFAGSSVVHSVGGWAALAMVLIIGPRAGRFEHGQQTIQGHNLPLAVLGVILLWFGWFGFNGGSTLAANSAIPAILVNTCLSAMFGGIAALFLEWCFTRVVNVIACMNGVLGGLVGITAACNIVSAPAAVLIGLTSGAIVIAGSMLLVRCKVDDAIDVIPVHLFAGIWGTLAVALFAPEGAWGTGLNQWGQLKVQILGIASIGGYAFGVSYLLLSLINRYYPLRVTRQAEMMGLNISEHNASTEIMDLFQEMEAHKIHGDFSRPVTVEPFTEAGCIAQQYNHVIAKVNQEISRREKAIQNFKTSESRRDALLEKALDCIITIDNKGLIREFNPAAEKCFGYSRNRVLGKSFVEYFVLQDEQQDFLQNLENNFAINSRLSLDRNNRINLRRMHGVEFPAEIAINQAGARFKHSNEFNLHIRDVTRLQKIQQKMAKMAFHDPLTPTYNRSYFHKVLLEMTEISRRRQHSLTLMFLDLDHFKSINDNFDHKVGDKVLITVSDRLTVIIRERDIVCRWGGGRICSIV